MSKYTINSVCIAIYGTVSRQTIQSNILFSIASAAAREFTIESVVGAKNSVFMLSKHHEKMHLAFLWNLKNVFLEIELFVLSV